MEEWRSTAKRSNPNICLATARAFSPRQNTGLLCAIPSQMVSLFDRLWLLHTVAVGWKVRVGVLAIRLGYVGSCVGVSGI